MNRRLQIKHKRESYNWSRGKYYRRIQLVDLFPKNGPALPILEEWDRLIPVGREIL